MSSMDIEHLVKRQNQNCYYDRFGRVRCSLLSNGARIGIGVGVAVGVLLLFLLLGGLCRRRRNRSSTAPLYHTTQPPVQQGGGYNAGYVPNQYGNNDYQPPASGPYPSYAYPPPVDGQKPYAPPSDAPPMNHQGSYAAPAMPPPSYAKV